MKRTHIYSILGTVLCVLAFIEKDYHTRATLLVGMLVTFCISEVIYVQNQIEQMPKPKTILFIQTKEEEDGSITYVVCHGDDDKVC